MGTKGRAPHLRPKSLYPHFHFHWVGLCPEKLANKGRREEGEPLEGKKLHCVVPKIIHTSPMGPLSTPYPREFPVPSVGGVWIFSGTTHCDH